MLTVSVDPLKSDSGVNGSQESDNLINSTEQSANEESEAVITAASDEPTDIELAGEGGVEEHNCSVVGNSINSHCNDSNNNQITSNDNHMDTTSTTDVVINDNNNHQNNDHNIDEHNHRMDNNNNNETVITECDNTSNGTHSSSVTIDIFVFIYGLSI